MDTLMLRHMYQLSIRLPDAVTVRVGGLTTGQTLANFGVQTFNPYPPQTRL